MFVIYSLLINKMLPRRKLIILAGNFLEFYEFSLFSALIPIISPLLFPSNDVLTSYSYGYLMLLIAFLARPVGAFIFGYIGDVYGRKIATMSSILVMSLTTIGMGLLPENNPSIFVFLILIFFRVLQGLSAGGEYSGAGLLLVENTEAKEGYFSGAALTASGLFGASVATALAALVSLTNIEKELWRVLFLVGGFVGLIIFISRGFLQEKVIMKIYDKSWRALFSGYKKQLICIIIFGGLMNVPFQILTGFINTYFIAVGSFSKTTLMFINSAVICFAAIMTIFFGLISQKFNPVKMMKLANILMFILAIPLFLMLEATSIFSFISAELLLLLISQLFVAPAFAVLTKIFPYNLRYRGLAIGLSIGTALFGGCAPYISLFLINYTGLSWAPAIYILGLSLMSFVCLVTLERKDIIQNKISECLVNV